jgi:Ran GTPase-activating protein (RanGAP) involved in mRNA processing and transport
VCSCQYTSTALASIYLDSNDIYEQGALAISEALKVNSSLTLLSLGGNFLHDTGACSIAEALKVNSSLTFLSLENNGIHDDGAFEIADAFKENLSLTALHLHCNVIGYNGALALAKELRVHPSLLKFVFEQDFRECFDGFPNPPINTQQDFKVLLQMLIGRDGAQVLANQYCMKFVVEVVYN